MFVGALVVTVITLQVPDLLQEATDAQRKGKLMEASALLEAHLEIHPTDTEARVRLAELYSIAGLTGLSTREYVKAFRERCKPCTVKPCWNETRCRKLGILSSRKVEEGEERVPRYPRLTQLAKKLFVHGKRLVRKRKYDEARRYLRAVLILDPTYGRAVPLLEKAYKKLKDRKGLQEFYLWYLRMRPAGSHAAKIRKKLKGKDLLGKVDIESSWPCLVTVDNHLLTDRRGREKKTPVTGLTLPEGRYSIGFICMKHHLAKRFWITVRKGQTVKVSLKYGVLRVRVKPWARAYLHFLSGQMKGRRMDLGLFEEIGIPEGTYTLEVVAHDKSRQAKFPLTVKDGTYIDLTAWDKPPKIKEKSSKSTRRHRRRRRRRR